MQVKSESLQTLITGGISFDTLDPKAPTVTKVRRFTLFDSEEAAMARGVEIQLSIDNADGSIGIVDAQLDLHATGHRRLLAVEEGEAPHLGHGRRLRIEGVEGDPAGDQGL